jgi:hypothetical protein
LTEQQWIPIHRVSKQLSGRFKSTDWDSNLKQQFDELDDILEQAERTLVAKINDDMDSLSDEVTR